jgi:CRISPR-associated protein Cas5t
MIILHVEVPYASFRKSFARSFAETYMLPPPSTIYGMLLSLVGERFRKRHEGVRLAFAFKQLPKIATTVRKLSRFKYGVASKQSKLGNAPDFIETLCGIEFLCWIDSSEEIASRESILDTNKQDLESRITKALQSPSEITRYGILSLGLSDDAVNNISLCRDVQGSWYRLIPQDTGNIDLPVWVDHVGAINTRWQRYEFESVPSSKITSPGDANWKWTKITTPNT